jgi:hypothetical protein
MTMIADSLGSEKRPTHHEHEQTTLLPHLPVDHVARTHCGPPEQISWRFRFEGPRRGRQQVFADIASLMTALQALTTAEEHEGKEG